MAMHIMHIMKEDKIRFGIVMSEGLEKGLSKEVKKGKYLKVNRSEVIETMLEMVFEKIENRDKFSEYLRSRIIEKRKANID